MTARQKQEDPEVLQTGKDSSPLRIFQQVEPLQVVTMSAIAIDY